MNRLTVKSDITGLPMPKALQESCGEDCCEDVCEIYGESGCVDCPVQKSMTKLSAYEDTGLEPEELQEYLQRHYFEKLHDHISELLDFEKQGRLIKLPCKVGDTVYCIDDIGTKRKPKHVIKEHIVDGYIIGEHLGIALCSKENEWTEFGDIENIGKTVFLTREEAGQALKGAGK